MNAFDISTSALTAERKRFTVIANNIANANTTRDSSGRVNPYRRKSVVFEVGSIKGSKEGVRISEIKEDQSDFIKIHNPGHPDADKDGNVLFPNVRREFEMADMIAASRAYDANITALQATKSMINSAMRLIA